MPVAVPSPAETSALRDGAALVDRSDRGRLALSGAESREALNAVVTNEIESLTPGHGCLAACCTSKGRMLGDLRVLATEDELLLDIERCALQPIFDAVRHGLVGYDAELHKRTLETSLFSLLGPRSRAVSFTKGCYVGQETIARLHYRGRPNRRLCSLKLSGEAELGSPLSTAEREVGTLTSLALSPQDGPIGLALIRREAQDGATLKVGDGPVEATLFHAVSGQ